MMIRRALAALAAVLTSPTGVIGAAVQSAFSLYLLPAVDAVGARNEELFAHGL